MHFLTKLVKLSPFPGKVLDSFKEQSQPDFTFHIAGLNIGLHSDGMPWGAPNYLTLDGRGSEQLSSSPVPELGTALLVAMGMFFLLLLRKAK